MIVNIKSLQGDEYQVEVHNNQLVSDLKAAICDKARDLSADMQRLVYKGRTMHDSTPICDYLLEDGCKIHLLLPKQSPEKATASYVQRPLDPHGPKPLSQRKFEQLLRDRLLRHFEPATIDRIMANLEHEIQADVHSSSLDDLERLAEQKLKIN